MRTEYADPDEMDLRTVLYLDLDDTLVSWANGSPSAAPGAREFLLWALERFSVRWLTTWCPTGEMQPSLLADLARMLALDAEVLAPIRGFDWNATDTKLNGIAWLDHVVLGRPFLWIEDEYGFGERERRFLAEHGFLARYRHCNVSADMLGLERLHEALEREWEAGEHEWEPPGEALYGLTAAAGGEG